MNKYSVCIATYNGEKHIREQIQTIVDQTYAVDEIIISDDGSTDGTIDIVKELQQSDSRIKIFKGPQMGFASNFGHAMQQATMDVILLCDQDDVWEKDKVEKIEKVFSSNQECTTVMHAMSTFRVDSDLTQEITIGYRKGFLLNYIKSCYWGCCMAVKREFIQRFLPFRNYCVEHDQLVGLFSEKYGKTIFLEDKLIRHRLHANNTSYSLPWKKKIEFRVELGKDYIWSDRIYKARGK